jgi:hypothetical protein
MSEPSRKTLADRVGYLIRGSLSRGYFGDTEAAALEKASAAVEAGKFQT